MINIKEVDISKAAQELSQLYADRKAAGWITKTSFKEDLKRKAKQVISRHQLPYDEISLMMSWISKTMHQQKTRSRRSKCLQLEFKF